jgi:hypothetical protein
MTQKTKRASAQSKPAKSGVVPPPPAVRVPDLRAAFWLYLAVLIGSILTYYLPSTVAPDTYLGLLSGLIVEIGFVFAAVFINQYVLKAMIGTRPPWRTLGLMFISGFALWLPIFWLQLVGEGLLRANFGMLQPPAAQALNPNIVQPPLVFALIVAMIILPTGQSLVFWAYIRSGLVGQRWANVILLALFALFGLYVAGGLTGIPQYLVLGILVIVIYRYIPSVWSAGAVIAGFKVAPLVMIQVLAPYFGTYLEDAGNPFSGRWLLLLVVMIFVTFLFTQVIRALRDDPSTETPAPHTPAPLRRWWWAPIAISLGLTLALGAYELSVRERYPVPYNDTGSTSAPLPTPAN